MRLEQAGLGEPDRKRWHSICQTGQHTGIELCVCTACLHWWPLKRALQAGGATWCRHPIAPPHLLWSKQGGLKTQTQDSATTKRTPQKCRDCPFRGTRDRDLGAGVAFTCTEICPPKSAPVLYANSPLRPQSFGGGNESSHFACTYHRRGRAQHKATV